MCAFMCVFVYVCVCVCVYCVHIFSPKQLQMPFFFDKQIHHSLMPLTNIQYDPLRPPPLLLNAFDMARWFYLVCWYF